MTMVIVSLTTIPQRKDTFLKTLPYILNQRNVKKICINVDDNLEQADYDFYEKEVASKDFRIEINKKCDHKWRSANKLIPTLMKYPDDIIVIMDDDISYDKDCVSKLIEMYEKNPDCIIAHEVNPVKYENGELRYENSFDVKLLQKEYGKYLTNCCLFPPHVFDGTDVYNYEKMMQLTFGTHDELWFWEQTVLKGIKTIGLNCTMSFYLDSKINHNNEDYKLSDINSNNDKIKDYNDAFNREYGTQIKTLLDNSNNCIEFNINIENFMAHALSLSVFSEIYGTDFNYKFILDKSIKKSHKIFLENNILKHLKKFVIARE